MPCDRPRSTVEPRTLASSPAIRIPTWLPLTRTPFSEQSSPETRIPTSDTPLTLNPHNSTLSPSDIPTSTADASSVQPVPSTIIPPPTIGNADSRKSVRSSPMLRSRMIDAPLPNASRSVRGPLSAVESITAISLFASSSAATASTNPAPEAGSNPAGGTSCAVPIRMSRINRRSSSGLPPSAASSAGCASSISAATPATCGAAADDPEKRGPNCVCSDTVTRSTATSSGFDAPFTVGPRLEYEATASRPTLTAPTVSALSASDCARRLPAGVR